MKSDKIRKKFIKFFKKKKHKIIKYDTINRKNDKTLMFTNSGMNQFKNYFLEIKNSKYLRIANYQKCLRITGKHNDIEEVGYNIKNHTMFEMLGNWSFGDYYKKEIINWSIDLLINVFKINIKHIYVTIFCGSKKLNIPFDYTTYYYWKKILKNKQIIFLDKKNNFWEMGETGPCGICTEIYIYNNKKKLYNYNIRKLILSNNKSIIELWNIVFIKFNKNKNGDLIKLKKKYVDCGMGLERLCMILQKKKSNYDTDIFCNIIKKIEKIINIKYKYNKIKDIYIRIISDHIRSISFSISDNNIPSNNKSGYVIRKLIRRSIIFSYLYLNQKKPFLYKIINTVVKKFGNIYNELILKEKLIKKILFKEEKKFFFLIKLGKNKLYKIIKNYKKNNNNIFKLNDINKLYDTFGIPIILSKKIIKKNKFIIKK